MNDLPLPDLPDLCLHLFVVDAEPEPHREDGRQIADDYTLFRLSGVPEFFLGLLALPAVEITPWALEDDGGRLRVLDEREQVLRRCRTSALRDVEALADRPRLKGVCAYCRELPQGWAILDWY